MPNFHILLFPIAIFSDTTISLIRRCFINFILWITYHILNDIIIKIILCYVVNLFPWQIRVERVKIQNEKYKTKISFLLNSNSLMDINSHILHTLLPTELTLIGKWKLMFLIENSNSFPSFTADYFQGISKYSFTGFSVEENSLYNIVHLSLEDHLC